MPVLSVGVCVYMKIITVILTSDTTFHGNVFVWYSRIFTFVFSEYNEFCIVNYINCILGNFTNSKIEVHALDNLMELQ